MAYKKANTTPYILGNFYWQIAGNIEYWITPPETRNKYSRCGKSLQLFPRLCCIQCPLYTVHSTNVKICAEKSWVMVLQYILPLQTIWENLKGSQENNGFAESNACFITAFDRNSLRVLKFLWDISAKDFGKVNFHKKSNLICEAFVPELNITKHNFCLFWI